MFTKNSPILNSLIYGSLITLTILDGSASQRENEDTCCCFSFFSKKTNVRQELEVPNVQRGISSPPTSEAPRNFFENAVKVKEKFKQENQDCDKLAEIIADVATDEVEGEIKKHVKNRRAKNFIFGVVNRKKEEALKLFKE